MPTSEAQKRANIAYNRRQDNIMLRPSKEDGARIRKAAADAGKSVQRYCLDILLDTCPPAEVLKAETLSAIEEVNEMIQTGKSEHFNGSAEDFLKKILDEPAGNTEQDKMKALYNQIVELAHKYGAKRLVLYGSRARGDNRHNSDIDLAVYEMPEKNRANFWMDCEELPTLLKFDIVHITDDMNPVFLANIKKDGVELYAAKD